MGPQCGEWVHGEENSALGHGIHIPLETEPCEVTDHVFRKSVARRKVFQLLIGKPQVFEKFDDRLEPRCHEESPLIWQGAYEEFENGGLVHPPIQVTLKHGELIEVCQEGLAFGFNAFLPVKKGCKSFDPWVARTGRG